MFFSRIGINPDVRDLHLLIAGNGYGAHQLLWKLFPHNGDGRAFLFREEVAKEQRPFHRGAKGQPIFYTVSENPPMFDHPIFTVESKVYSPRVSAGDRLSFRLRANPTIARKQEGRKNSIRHDTVMDAQHQLLSEVCGDIGCSPIGKKSDLKKQILSAWSHTADRSVLEKKLLSVITETGGNTEFMSRMLSSSRLLDLALEAKAKESLETWLIERGKKGGFAIVEGSGEAVLKLQAEGYQWHPLPKKGRTAGFSTVDYEGELEVVDADLFSKVLFNGIGPAKGFGCGLMMVRRQSSSIGLC